MNYDYRPQRQNYTAHAIVVLLFLLSGLCFGFAGFFPLPGFLWQALGLAVLLPAIQLIARYMASRYLYRLHTYEDGHTDLEIFLYRGGDKMQLVCRTDLAQITAVAFLGAENAAPPKRLKRYHYVQDLRPAQATVISISNEDGECEILFCPDEYMHRVLQEAVLKKDAAKDQ